MPRNQGQSTPGKPHRRAQPRCLNHADPRLDPAHGASNNSTSGSLSYNIDFNYLYGPIDDNNSTSTHAGVDTAEGQTFGSNQTDHRGSVVNSSIGYSTIFGSHPSAAFRENDDDNAAKYETNFNPYSSWGSSDAHSSLGVSSLYQTASTSIAMNSRSTWHGLYPGDICLEGPYPNVASIGVAGSYNQQLSYTQSDNPNLGNYGAASTYSPRVSGVTNNCSDVTGTDSRSGQLPGPYNNYTGNPSELRGSKSAPSRRHSSVEVNQGSTDGNPAGQTTQGDEGTRRGQDRMSPEESLHRENRIDTFINGEGPWVVL
ncbi:uncharacterized protein F4812DRAFT_464582 [Daldinia caldariorum]|uniref:uncharacterized protein n=1 Tax=Daldinia caldariorum TaxID=326644 RepID=UPI00200764B0|nr:uncharacterized protein F4812DRAFT_464582 [Daldinia caldariorum]KAI1472478.1 hypothetical protein F4812DRAFT_464582 [Daldinia caldariorum]